MEVQRREEVGALIDSFYRESVRDATKPAWSTDNFKKFMMLGYINFLDVHKFRSEYLASKEDESVFVDLPPEENVPSNSNSEKLLGEYDGFSLKPKKPLKSYTRRTTMMLWINHSSSST